jgi:hypothetical protein
MKSILHKADGTVEVFDDRTLLQAQAERIEFLREITTQHISQTCPQSTQQNAALGIYSPERCEAIKNYIAACRNEYLRCKGLILAATSNEAADSVQFQPPSVPENL